MSKNEMLAKLELLNEWERIIEEAKAEAFIKRYKTDGYAVYWAGCDTCIGVKINEDVLKGLLPGMSFGNMILPLWSFDSYDIE